MKKLIDRQQIGNRTTYVFRHNPSARARSLGVSVVVWDRDAVEAAYDEMSRGGPVSSMPGAKWRLAPAILPCENHKDKDAVYRTQGETDSFGAEYAFLCEECTEKIDASRRAWLDEPDNCEWCGKKAPLRETRDYDEGMSGPVYLVCAACRQKQQRDLAEELSEYDNDY